MRKHAKKDDNHRAIVRDLLCAGFSVMETHQLGDDKPDIVVALRGETAVVEIKNPETDGKLSTGQSDFFRLWQGKKIIAYRTSDILSAFGLISVNKTIPAESAMANWSDKIGIIARETTELMRKNDSIIKKMKKNYLI